MSMHVPVMGLPGQELHWETPKALGSQVCPIGQGQSGSLAQSMSPGRNVTEQQPSAAGVWGQSVGQLHASSPPSQQWSPHRPVLGQSVAQLKQVSEMLQQPSPHVSAQSAGQPQ